MKKRKQKVQQKNKNKTKRFDKIIYRHSKIVIHCGEVGKPQ